MKLNFFKSVPESLYHSSATELHADLGGPSLIHLEFGNKDPIFISTLLHGNEHSGFMAVQKILQLIKGGQCKPARPIIFFLGNTLAATKNQRRLDHQIDFNRVWSGGDCELADIAREVIDYGKKNTPFCSIDIHNNTGKNPFYSCINRIDNEFLFLADFFFDKIVYFTTPHEVQSMAFSHICPSITIEAGNSGDMTGVNVLVDRILKLLELDTLTADIDRSSLDVFHTTARLITASDTKIDFDYSPQSKSHYSFLNNLEELNFKEVTAGTQLAYTNGPRCLMVQEGPLEDRFEEYFIEEKGKLVVKKTFYPAMITRDLKIIQDDCLGYVMERYPV